MESLRGHLLIAGGGLFDPNFRQTVVLIARHAEDGAFGLVINRRARLPVAAIHPELGELAGPDDDLVYYGGPVQPDVCLVLADFGTEPPPDAIVGTIGLVPSDRSERELARFRVYCGYAGWAPGQLESEIERGDWIVENAHPEDVFTANPEGLWSRLLRRKGGEYALLATMPFDPTLN